MVKKDVARWLVVLVVAVLTALVGCSIDIAIESLSKFKYTWLKTCILIYLCVCMCVCVCACVCVCVCVCISACVRVHAGMYLLSCSIQGLSYTHVVLSPYLYLSSYSFSCCTLFSIITFIQSIPNIYTFVLRW